MMAATRTRTRTVVRVYPAAIRQLPQIKPLADHLQGIGRAIVREAQAIARTEAYDSGAYHDSMHTEPDEGVRPDGVVTAVAGGAVNPRWAPRAGVVRGPDVDYAAALEVHGAGSKGQHIMRRAADRVVSRRKRRKVLR